MDGNNNFQEINGSVASQLSTFRIVVGLGGDINLGERLFLRMQVIGHYRFSSREEREIVDAVGGLVHSYGFGVTPRFGFGFKF